MRWWRDAGWLARGAWIVGGLQFALVTMQAYSGGGLDLYWVYKGVHAFLHGGHPYDYRLFVNPPAALVLLTPLGFDGFHAVRVAYMLVDAAALVAAGLLCLRVARIGYAGVAGGALLLALAEMPAVRLTQALENVNGLVFLAEAVALAAMIAGRWDSAGLALGLSFAIKPILVPLLLFPLVARRWRCAALAVATPLALSGAALALNRHATGFFDHALPFLLKGNDPHLRPSNVSIVGAFHNLDLPRAGAEVLRYAVLMAAAWLAWRRWSERPDGGRVWRWSADPMRVLEATGLLMLPTILCFSFSWNYYGLYLIPFLVTIAHPRSLLRNVLSYVGLFLILSPVELAVPGRATASMRFEQVRPTVAWLLLLAGAGLTLRRRSRPGGRPAPASPPPQPARASTS